MNSLLSSFENPRVNLGFLRKAVLEQVCSCCPDALRDRLAAGCASRWLYLHVSDWTRECGDNSLADTTLHLPPTPRCPRRVRGIHSESQTEAARLESSRHRGSRLIQRTVFRKIVVTAGVAAQMNKMIATDRIATAGLLSDYKPVKG